MLSDEELRQNIRLNLVYMRNRKGLKQSDVAEIAGKKNNTIASWEQGLSLPDLQTLYRLSRYYGKSLEWFYENTEREEL